MRPDERVDSLLGSEETGSLVSGPRLSTGSTLLNLACGNDAHVGLWPGKYYLVVGDATAGKTFLAMSILAEAVQNPDFDKYRLIYDNCEDGCLMDLDRLFGVGLRKRLEAPERASGSGRGYSSTIEEFYFALDTALTQGPTIYILDSMDALTSAQEIEHFAKLKKATKAATAAPGSFGMSKAKKNSEYLRRTLKPLRESGSILLILSQTRDDLGFGFAKKTRAGGHSLRFYATVEIWASVVGTIKKSIRKKDRQIGVKVRWRVKKNRITGRLGEVDFELYPSYGIDDIGSCIDYLVDEGWWSMKGRTITAESMELSGTREKLISVIEDKGLEDGLHKEVGLCWAEIEDGGKLVRKGRY